MFFTLSDNSSFQVDFREFMLALCVMRTGTAEENLKQIFRAFDVNSDGKVAIRNSRNYKSNWATIPGGDG